LAFPNLEISIQVEAFPSTARNAIRRISERGYSIMPLILESSTLLNRRMNRLITILGGVCELFLKPIVSIDVLYSAKK